MAVEGANQMAEEQLSATTGTYAVNCWTGSGYSNGASGGMTLYQYSAQVGVTAPGRYRVILIAINTGSYASGTTVTMTITCCGQTASTSMPLSNQTHVHVFSHEFDVAGTGTITGRADPEPQNYVSFTTYIISAQKIG